MKTDWFDSAELRRGSMLTVSWWIYLRGYQIISLCNQWRWKNFYLRWSLRNLYAVLDRPMISDSCIGRDGVQDTLGRQLRSWSWLWLKLLNSIGSYLVCWDNYFLDKFCSLQCECKLWRRRTARSHGSLHHNRSYRLVQSIRCHSPEFHCDFRLSSLKVQPLPRQRQWRYWLQSPTKRRI